MLQKLNIDKSFLLKGLNLLFHILPKENRYRFIGILLKKNLSGTLLPLNTMGYTFKKADLEELQYIGGHSESDNYEVYKNRFKKGHICFCAKNKIEVMCYIWISPSICGILFGTENEVQILNLKEKQAYSYDLYTYKKYRKKGIASQLQNFTNLSLKNSGINERFNIIGPNFIGSMKISLRAGFKPQRMIYIYGIKNYRKVIIGRIGSEKLKRWEKSFKMIHKVNKQKSEK